jgi:hypothetical protein
MMSTRRCERTGRIGEVMLTKAGWYATLSPEEAMAQAEAEGRPREFFAVEKSNKDWPPPEPDLAARRGYSKAGAQLVLHARHIACLSGDAVLDFPPALFYLADVALQVISCRPHKSDPARPLVVVKQVIWSDIAGLSIVIDPNSLTQVAEAIAAQSQADRSRALGEPPSIDAEIRRLKNHCQGVHLFTQILSSKMDLRDGRIGPVDDDGNLIDE